jgi:CheY-like chemotaxis protein
VRLAVQDNGMGIEPALLPHVFDLFTQGERTPDRSQGGLGIGLALVKALVSLHHGEVAVHSDGKGQGSCFTVVLPLAAGQGAADAPESGPQAAIGPLHILLTDDNVDAAESLAALLRIEGHQVDVCYNGAQALAQAARHVPDVCILDVGLPDMTGLELARRLRADAATRSALLVALTGYGQPHDRRASAEAGFDHHLVKPVEPVALEALLVDYARRRPGVGGPGRE